MRRIRLLLPLCVLTLAGCPRRTAVWIAEGSTAADLTLVFGEHEGRERRMNVFIGVAPCGAMTWDSAFWAVSIDTSRVTYGIAGPGVHEERPARALEPGCYHVYMSGTGDAAFAVDSAGRVTPLDSVPRSYYTTP